MKVKSKRLISNRSKIWGPWGLGGAPGGALKRLLAVLLRGKVDVQVLLVCSSVVADGTVVSLVGNVSGPNICVPGWGWG